MTPMKEISSNEQNNINFDRCRNCCSGSNYFCAFKDIKCKKEKKDKINREKKAQIEEEITLQNTSTGENLSKDDFFQQTEEPQHEEMFDESFEEPESQYDRREELYPRMPERSFANNARADVDRDRDFETFLNEHAYSRKIFDKTLLEKIREMPPEMKAIVLGNLFDRFND